MDFFKDVVNKLVETGKFKFLKKIEARNSENFALVDGGGNLENPRTIPKAQISNRN